MLESESKSVTKLKNKLGRVPTEQEIAKYEAKQEKKRRKREEATARASARATRRRC